VLSGAVRLYGPNFETARLVTLERNVKYLWRNPADDVERATKWRSCLASGKCDRHAFCRGSRYFSCIDLRISHITNSLRTDFFAH
jgi:hypothetical protein